WYIVDNAGDVINEAPGDPLDRVFASVSYTLTPGARAEERRVGNDTSTGAINLTGNEFNNIIYGNAGNNVLSGMGGDDTLLGMGGTDTFNCGTGNYWYIVDNAGDVINEAPGDPLDRVFASVSYTLTPGA